jgi:3-oxoacyl-(acyl-carrier-protein) synthase
MPWPVARGSTPRSSVSAATPTASTPPARSSHHAPRHGTGAGRRRLTPEAIGYVNGHGTATEQGDIAETLATSSLFGEHMPISSQKSFLGHTLGACGALESWFSIEMMNRDLYVHTLNLDEVDPHCGKLDYLRGEFRQMSTNT